MGLQAQADFYRRGNVYVARAISADERGQLEKAIQCYGSAVENFLAGLGHDRQPRSRAKIIKALGGYLSRAEKLKGVMDRTKPKQTSRRQECDPNALTEMLPELTPSSESTSAKYTPLGDEGFAGVAGLGDVKRALREAVILPMVHPRAFQGGRKPWRGVLLYGPPGTGKSHVAAALSREAKCAFISLSASDLVSKHQGESERLVKAVFNQARAKRPCVIFLDEIDSIGRSRDSSSGSTGAEASRRLLTELLRQLDGVGSDCEGITFLAATNHPFDIDSALRRRFQKRIYVPMPGPKARARILRLGLDDDRLTSTVSQHEIERIAANAKGYSGSDLANVANEALMIPLRKCLGATHFKQAWIDRDGTIGALKQGEDNQGWGVVGFFKQLVGIPDQNAVLVPCSPYDPMGKRISMLDPDFPAEKLQVPPVTSEDLETALIKLRPSVDSAHLDTYKCFAETFGDKNAIKDFEDSEADYEDELDQPSSSATKRPASRVPPSTPASANSQQKRQQRQLVAG